MKKTILLLSLISSNIAFASGFETTYINYKSNTQYLTDNKFKFPFVTSDNKAADNKINTTLHLSVLGMLPPSEITKKTISIGKIETNDIIPEEVKTTNSDRVIGFHFSLEGCGAYCENYNNNFYFDTRNGRVIVYQEILNPKMISQLSSVINKSYLNTTKTFLDKIKKNVKKHRNEEAEEQIAMYKSCLTERNAKTKDSYYKNFLGSMDIIDGGLTFTYERCSNHAMRALDELGDVSTTIKIDELTPYLSEYGKYIFLGEGEGNVPKTSKYSQLYKGKLNDKIELVLLLGDIDRNNNEDRTTHYSFYNQEKYAYVKNKKAIPLLIEINNTPKEYTLSEDMESENKGYITFKKINGNLIGKWKNNEKEFSFEAVPFD